MSSTYHFEKHLEKANVFMNFISENLGISDKDKVNRIFRSVIHALRDSISFEESLQLIAQLPFILKAVYVENWSAKNKGRKVKHLDDFIEKVMKNDKKNSDNDFYDFIEAERACKIIFNALYDFTSEGEMNDIKSTLPEEIRSLFDTDTVII